MTSSMQVFILNNSYDLIKVYRFNTVNETHKISGDYFLGFNIPARFYSIPNFNLPKIFSFSFVTRIKVFKSQFIKMLMRSQLGGYTYLHIKHSTEEICFSH